MWDDVDHVTSTSTSQPEAMYKIRDEEVDLSRQDLLAKLASGQSTAILTSASCCHSAYWVLAWWGFPLQCIFAFTVTSFAFMLSAA